MYIKTILAVTPYITEHNTPSSEWLPGEGKRSHDG